jgi:hypothetical protein
MSKLAVVPSAEPVTVTLVKFEEKKGSVRYNAEGDDPAMTSAYIMKYALPKPYPQRIKVQLIFGE